jgi:hypothetical protein
MPAIDARAPSIALGLAAAILYQLALVVTLVVGAPLLLGERDPFEAPPLAFPLVVFVGTLQVCVIMGLMRWGRVSLHDLGWRSDRLAADVVRGTFGFVLIVVLVVAVRLTYGALRGQNRSLIAPAVAHGLCWVVLGSL